MSLFVTAIGTGVGKTLVSANLSYHGNIPAYKPIESGIENGHTDAEIFAQISGKAVSEISPWRFRAPLSPHLAAAQEGQRVEPPELLAWTHARLQEGECIIEGVGGLQVPIDGAFFVSDWIAALKLPVALVSSSYLGAINHTLLSLELLRARQIPVQGIIVSQALPDCDAGLGDTLDTLRQLGHDEKLIALPRQPHSDTPWKDMPDLLSLLYER